MSTDQEKKGSAEDADKDYESRCDPDQEARWLKVVLLNLPEYSVVTPHSEHNDDDAKNHQTDADDLRTDH